VILRLAELLPGTPIDRLLAMYVDDGVEILLAASAMHEAQAEAIRSHTGGSGSAGRSFGESFAPGPTPGTQIQRVTGGLDVLRQFMR
jgi:hypothetical protein